MISTAEKRRISMSAKVSEWIEFNHIVGVDHFFLYNNNSEDNYEEIIEPYVKKGIVTLIQWPKNQAQMECYNDCIFKYSRLLIEAASFSHLNSERTSLWR